MSMRIVDLHCDTMIECWRDPARKLRDNQGHLSLMKMQKGEALCQFFAAYISRNELKTMEPNAIFQGIYGEYVEEMAENKDLILPAYTYQDIMDNAAAGKMSGILAIEDGIALEGKMENLIDAYEKGVRLITLLWNFENELGFPCKDDPEEHMKGLKPFGLEVVEKMNELGMIIDTSHMSEGGFWDIVKHSKTPFVASHSSARAICNHRRNLTDEQLKAIGEKGGVAGVNFEETFLNSEGRPLMYDDVVKHCVHMADKAGVEALALGSDFDGIEATGEMGDYSNYPVLIDRLNKHFTMDQIDMITHKNALRVIKDVLK